ncbi:hypothetical protein TRICI_006423 [Trichomonascus ciferrii]|uniref:ribonuclease Z n=1 Tax=Trichomonascus ciferrii TaxID=44093 RepID=A0A642UH46_9ASCO|nr:hypothetical protein TRICI_006423 [Trichomonascus ciferrii]
MLLRSGRILTRRLRIEGSTDFVRTKSSSRIIGKELDLFHGRSDLERAISTRGSMKTFIQVLSHPTSDNSEPCIVLQTLPGTKYVIGRCGEGLQRSLNQNKIRMGKLKSIFLTGCLDWKGVGGLPGFLLTVNEQGSRSLTLHSAGQNLSYACSTWRKFMFHNQLDLQISCPDSVYQDDHVAIGGVAIRPDGYKDSETPQEQLDYKILQGRHNKTDLDPTTPDRRSSCYIVQIMPSRGRFLVDKAKELGVPPGKMYSQLTNGQTVVTEAGVTVRPEDVIEAAKVPPRVLVIDCPAPEYVSGVIAEDWKRQIYTKKRKNGQNPIEEIPVDIKLVYHFPGKDVDPFAEPYFSWMQSFGPDCLHQISHPVYSPNGIMLESAALLNMKLRYHTSSSQFPRLYTADAERQFPADLPSNIGPMHALDLVALEPEVKKKVEESSMSMDLGYVDWDKIEKQAGFYRQEEDPQPATNRHETEPQIITVGTGSAIPSKYRNVISTVVRTQPESVVLDCGEGTLGNLSRLYGPEGLSDLLQHITTVYISHLHADHHLGTVSLLREWLLHNPSPRTIELIGPWLYHEFIQEWTQLEPWVDWNRVKFVDTEQYMVGIGFRGRPGGKIGHQTARPLKACKAFHCEYAYSVNMKIGDIYVAFSGDTRPNDFFATRVGKNCDVLIHEATHDDELLEEAKLKKHSTIGEALQIGNQMNAKNIVLTHFSQRYPKAPELQSQDHSSHVAVGFDGMHLTLSQIPGQQSHIRPIQDMFDDE